MAISLFLSGCSTSAYLWQAGRGQLALINHARPIPEVIQDERTPPRIRDLLAEIPKIKKYGELHGLKATPNYQEYVKLDRPAAVWVVSACEPLRFASKQWSFPIVGSFPYLGWFDRDDAKKYAVTLREENLDVDVRGARAFSTLGWFRDSVLSTMIPEGEEAIGDLVNVIIHESVHATLYVKGQSSFNETLASFVADRMTPEYLRETRGPDSPELKAYLASERHYQEVEKIFHETYVDLEKLYSSSLPDSEKLEKKAALVAAAKKKADYPRDINNATLIQFRTYNTDQPVFGRLFQACGSDLKRFLAELDQRLGKPKDFPTPQMETLAPVLEPLITGSCR